LSDVANTRGVVAVETGPETRNVEARVAGGGGEIGLVEPDGLDEQAIVHRPESTLVACAFSRLGGLGRPWMDRQRQMPER
jgi:hypothetical protein